MKDLVEEYAIAEILSIRETLGQIDDQMEIQFGVRRFTLAKHLLTISALEIREVATSADEKIATMPVKEMPKGILEYFDGP